MTHSNPFPPKIPTRIAGFDELSDGGLPKGRAVVISGSAGSGKTIFGLEFLFRGISELGEPGVFVTFEERRTDLLMDVVGFGWGLEECEKRGQLAFVDASRIAENQVEVGEYDFGALITRIRYAVEKVKAKRVVIDSIGSLFLRYKDYALVRREMFKLISILRGLGVTALITAERVNDNDATSRFGVEDFVADSVIFLYNTAVGRQRERYIEVLKLRGGSHQAGRYPFLISSAGIIVFPRQSEDFAKDSPTARISIGVDGVDAMTSGGIFRGSTTLLKGPSGTGRTVLGLSFLAEGFRRRERGIMISFEEGRAQLFTDAKTIGLNFAAAEKRRLLRVLSWQPEERPIEAYLMEIRRIVDEFKPRRVVIDSVTPLVNAVDVQRFRHFIVSLNSFLKARTITSLINFTHSASGEGGSGASADLDVIADNIIKMRFAEVEGKMERIILIAKSRASSHDKEIRRYVINNDGMCVIGASDRACLEPLAELRRKKSRKK